MAWARERSRSLKQLAAAVKSGTAVAEPKSVGSAIEEFLEAPGRRRVRKESTVDGYRPSLAIFEAWSAKAGVAMLQDLLPHHLLAFREHAIGLTAAVPKAGGKRGRKVAGKRRRSDVTTNKTLVVAKSFLRWARDKGYLPNVDGDALRQRLGLLAVEREAVQFLRPPELGRLLEAALRHDQATFALTRAEHDGVGKPGTTPRYEACAPFTMLAALTGMRASEVIGLRWAEVDLESKEIRLPASRVKTASARTVTLNETPTAIDLLRALRLRTPGDRVFPAWSGDLAKSTRARLMKDFGAPAFTWQALRRSCAAVLTNAPAIYGGSSAYRSAKRAGHSVAIAEKHYVDLIRDLPRDAATFEAAAKVKKVCDQIVRAVGVVAEAEAASVAAAN